MIMVVDFLFTNKDIYHFVSELHNIGHNKHLQNNIIDRKLHLSLNNYGINSSIFGRESWMGDCS